MTRLFTLGAFLPFWVSLLLLSGLPGSQSMGQSQAGGITALEEIASIDKKPAFKSSKISSQLLEARAWLEHREIGIVTGQSIGERTTPTPWVQVDADRRLQAYLYVHTFGVTEQADLLSRDVDIELVDHTLGVVQAWIPMGALDRIAALPFVQQLTPPHYGMMQPGNAIALNHGGATATAQGRTITEGDALLLANALRELGVDGHGAKVAVIADGANYHAEAVATGDLPPDLAVYGSCTPTATMTCNFGTAMLEIIHDLAPGAELAIGALDFSRGVTSFDLMRRIDEVVEDFGANIVVHRVKFFQEPYFADGMVAQHVARHVADGVLYTLGAGDEAQNHYEADFSQTVANHFHIHDFGAAAGQASDLTMDVQVEPGETLTVWLQWDDPLNGARNDYDLFIIDATETMTLASGSDLQDGDDRPQEVAIFTNPTTDVMTVKLMVRKFSGAARRIEMFILGKVRIEEYGVQEGSIFGPEAVPGVMTVGAVSAMAPDALEPFSSWGPSRIAFPRREVRWKPDLTAVDGVLATGNGDLTNRFFGTSVAAAHVAGIAALLWQALPTATATDIREAMIESATNLGEPGPDMAFGAGLINALNTFQRHTNQPPRGVIVTPTDNVTLEVGERVRFTSRGTDPDGPFPLNFKWDFGGGAADTRRKNPGHVTFNTAGVFTITLTVSDGHGLSDPNPPTRQITVNVPPKPPKPPKPPEPPKQPEPPKPPAPPEPPKPTNQPPNGVITAPVGDITIEVGEHVHFASTGTDPDGPFPLSFRWDFGGGATNTIQDAPGDVTFNTAGVFTITLTAIDRLGLPDPTPAQRIVVVRKPLGTGN